LTEFNAGSNSKEETRETKDRREKPLTFEELNKSVKGRHGVGARFCLVLLLNKRGLLIVSWVNVQL